MRSWSQRRNRREACFSERLMSRFAVCKEDVSPSYWLRPRMHKGGFRENLEIYFDPDAIRSTTDSRCAGERWLYRADIVIVLWPAAS